MNASCSSSREIVRTRTPRFGTNETRPSAASRRSASRTGVRETLNCSDSCSCRRTVPGASSPDTIASSIITIFQGQGGTINDILDQTASLTSALADRDQAIGEVVKNLNTVLATTVKHQQQFDETVQNFEKLISGLNDRKDPIASSVANISEAAGTISDLLADNRPLLRDTVNYLDGIQQPLVDQKEQLNDLLQRFPQAVRTIGRAGGIYGDFFNFYACDISLILNGLQPGGPVRKVKITSQPSGRCTPQS